MKNAASKARKLSKRHLLPAFPIDLFFVPWAPPTFGQYHYTPFAFACHRLECANFVPIS